MAFALYLQSSSLDIMGLAQWRHIHALVSIRLDAFAPLVIDKALDFCAISTPS
jgi:hypothetical protein